MESHGVETDDIVRLATEILDECSRLDSQCEAGGIRRPTLNAGTSTTFWSDASPSVTEARARAIGRLRRLTALLEGPHEFLHEFVGSSWDHGALYAFLQSKALDHIAAAPKGISLDRLSESCGLPKDKLARILGLLCCHYVVQELETNVFALTAVSEEMVRDGDFRAWVEFQLFETRVASAHLADALTTMPNEYSNGKSGFEQGWGVGMYEWHVKHAEKGDRFRQAMKGVSKALDPADSLLRRWFEDGPTEKYKVVEIGGRYGFGSISLSKEKPDVRFEIRCDSQDFLDRGRAQLDPGLKAGVAFTLVGSLFDPPPSSDSEQGEAVVYLIRNMFWNWSDDGVIRLLRLLLPALRASAASRILVTDGVSPRPGEFPPHVELGFRRRDITTMTMHNAKQRMQTEWLQLFAKVDPAVKVTTTFETSSHVYKGLWEISLDSK